MEMNNKNPSVSESILLDNISIWYNIRGRKNPVLSNINISLTAGKLICLLGSNGTGKSSLIRSLAGLQAINKGKILLRQKDITTFSTREIAHLISVVLTGKPVVPNDVFSTVLLGRYPYSDWYGKITEADRLIAKESLELTGISD